MSRTKISALPAASTLTGAETIPLVQGGVTKKVTTDQFLTAANPSYTGTLTGGTGVVNLGSGQFYKDASGNVGLGTVSPTQRLTVEGRGIFSVADAVYATAFNATSGNFRVIPYLDSTSGTALTAYSAGYAGLGKMTFDASSMRFCTGGTERARIDASGNLLVGTTAAHGKFTVGDDSNAAATIKLSMSTSTTERGFISMDASNGEMRHSAGYGGYGGFQTFYTNGAEAARIDASGNLGLGVAPSAWNSDYKTHQIGRTSAFFGRVASNQTGISENAYRNAGGGWTYQTTGTAQRYEMEGGTHYWFTAPSGTAGNAISFTQAMTLDASGNLGIGTASPAVKLDVAGAINASSYVSVGAQGIMYGDAGNSLIIGADNGNSGASSRLQFNVDGTERARIDASGNLLVGATSASGKLHVTNTNNVSGDTAAYLAMGSNTNDASSYFLQCVTSGVGAKAYILGNGNMQNANNSYGAFSDLKLKENITDASSKLAKLMQVRIVNYTLKADPDKTKLLGVVAQELEQVSPGLIEQTPDFEDVTRTREVTKTVPVTEKTPVLREQKTVEVVDGKAIVKTEWLDEWADTPVQDVYPLFDDAGQPVLEVATPEVPEVLDEDGNVTKAAVPATYRQATHSVPRTQEVTETETYTERVPTGTTTKSVKYSIFVPMLIKALQEQQVEIVAMQTQLNEQNAAMQMLATRLAALEAN
jgi:hypothetical protein